MDAGSAAPPAAMGQVPRPPAWRGDGTIGRAVRFAATVLGPIGLALTLGVGTWMIFALVTAILCFSLDVGGRLAPRLGWMAGAGLVVLVGAGAGTLVSGLYLPTTLGFAAAGVLYALVEALDATAAAASRFLCFTFAIGAHYIHLDGAGALAALATVAYGFAVSALWDVAVGGPRPSLAPSPAGIARRLRDTAGERWRFAAAVGIVVPLASLASVGLGVAKPYWTLIAVVLVLRHDVPSSWRTMMEVMLGCVAGAAVALAVSAVVGGSHWGLMAGMMVAALIRWPAHEIHGILGNAALTMFVLLLLEVIAGSAGVATRDVEERVLDFSLGCGFALLALGLDALFDAVHRRLSAARRAG